MDVKKEIIEFFVKDSSELLENLESDLLEIEKFPDNNNLMLKVFRHLHTFKGNAALIDMADLEKLSHKTESVIDLMNSGKIGITKSNINLVLNIVDTFKETIDSLAKGKSGDIANCSEMINDLNSLIKMEKDNAGPDKIKERVVDLPDDDENTEINSQLSITEEVSDKTKQEKTEKILSGKTFGLIWIKLIEYWN